MKHISHLLIAEQEWQARQVKCFRWLDDVSEVNAGIQVSSFDVFSVVLNVSLDVVRSLCNIIRLLFLIGGPEIKLSKLNEHNVQGDV